MKRTHFALGVLIIATVVAVVAYVSTSPSDSDGALTPVTIRLDWSPGSEHSFLYLAKANNYFKDAGLDVTIQAGDGSTTSAKLVGNGTVDYALCSGDTALIAASAGAPLRVVTVLYSRPPTVIYARSDRGLSKPSDLEGMTYGAYRKSTTYNQFLAFCSKNDIDMDKVKVIATAGKAQDILTNAVDASGGYAYIQPVQCEVAGVQVDELLIADYGINCYSMSVIANRDKMIPDVTRALLRALLQGFKEMVEDPDSAFAAYLEEHPTANKDFEKKKLERVIAFVSQNLKTQGRVGSHTREGWQATQELLISQGLLEGPIDLDLVTTEQYLPDAK